MTMSLSGSELIGYAQEIAAAQHEHEQYGGKPFILHPQAVARLAEMDGYPPEVQAGCWLHDVPESRGTDGWELLDEIPSLVVVEGVVAVTSFAGQSEIDKMTKAKSHLVGTVIKAKDSTHNLATTLSNPARTTEQDQYGAVLKYARYLASLGVIPTPEVINIYLEMRKYREEE
jgi:(p)ppGpp synthase/HD superfamily hydrolase